MIAGDKPVIPIKDEIFSLLRQKFNIDEDFLVGAFKFTDLVPGGGKGGDLLCKTNCGKFFIKELSNGDKKSLLSQDFCEDYVHHLTKTIESTICRIYLVFVVPDRKSTFIAMENCIPHEITYWDGIYDLKGTADDKSLLKNGKRISEVHKRFWRVDLFFLEFFRCKCLVPSERSLYVEGKKKAFTFPISLEKIDKDYVLNLLSADVELFRKHSLMDYSMILAVVKLENLKEEELKLLRQLKNRTGLACKIDGVDYFLFLGIIDFLQAWTKTKMLAHVVKFLCAPKPISTVDPERYAKQFLFFFRNKFNK
jgi:hypothetical protein